LVIVSKDAILASRSSAEASSEATRATSTSLSFSADVAGEGCVAEVAIRGVGSVLATTGRDDTVAIFVGRVGIVVMETKGRR
jgi:hypothetical protein